MHAIEVRHDHVHDLQAGFGTGKAWIFGRVGERSFVKRWNWLIALPIGKRTKCGIASNQIVQVSRAGAGESGDDHRRFDFDVVNLWMSCQ